MREALVNALAVGSGGFLGALARYGMSGWVQRLAPMSTFPYGTLAVNLAGCFGIGVLAGLAEARQLFGPEVRAFALIGLLGGFTTFSTFGYETWAMVREADYLRAAANVGGHVLFGVLLVGMGYVLTSSR